MSALFLLGKFFFFNKFVRRKRNHFFGLRRTNFITNHRTYFLIYLRLRRTDFFGSGRTNILTQKPQIFSCFFGLRLRRTIFCV